MYNWSIEEISTLSKRYTDDYIKKYNDVLNNTNGQLPLDILIRLDQIDGTFKSQTSPMIFMGHVHPDKAIRDIADSTDNDIAVAIGKYIKTSGNMEKLENLVKSADPNHPLVQHYQRIIDNMGKSKIRMKLKEVRLSMAKLTSTFNSNLNAANMKKFYLTREQLSGVNKSFFTKRVKKTLNNKTKYEITPNWADYNAIMSSCRVAKTRAMMHSKFRERANDSNESILLRLLKLRGNEADMMGYPSHSHKILKHSLAEDPDTALNFLENLYSKVGRRYEEYLRFLTKLKQYDVGSAEPLNDYDLAYYSHKLTNDMYGVRPETIRKYFSVPVIVDNVIDIYQRILGLRFERTSNVTTWHPDVWVYNVFDSGSDRFMGKCLLDLYTRDGKFGHYAQFELRKHFITSDGHTNTPVTCMVANFNKINNTLTFGELITFFHEFGHIVHDLCSVAPYSALSGTNTAADFVEAPSQMLENWCLDVGILKHITGGMLPERIAENLIKGYKLSYIGELVSILALSMFDLQIQKLSSDETEKLTNSKIRKLYNDIISKYMKVNVTVYTPASWHHIAGGYSSRYYGYLYSRVYASSMFEEFRGKLLSISVGRRYRDKVLAPGRTKPTKQLFVDFTGKDEPSIDLFVNSAI